MKKYILTTLLLALTVASSAALDLSKIVQGGNTQTSEQVFLDNELQIDIFNAVNVTNDQYSIGAGVTRFLYSIPAPLVVDFGLGGEVTFQEGGGWSSAGSIIARAPIEEYGVAPYIYGGGGWVDTATFNVNEVDWHAGAGIDIRIKNLPTMFVDYRYTWSDAQEDNNSIRAGLKFLF